MNHKIQTEKSAKSAESARGFLNKVTTKNVGRKIHKKIKKSATIRVFACESASSAFKKLRTLAPSWQNNKKTLQNRSLTASSQINN